jgi:hypothetical protein
MFNNWMNRTGQPLRDGNKPIKHRIGWCSVCGFVHENVRPYTMVEHGYIVIKPICESCRKKERERSRMVVCAICGLVKGDNLYATTVERLTFEGVNTCNFIVPLCKDCRSKPHSEIREKLNLEVENICGSCPDRFKCYTAQHEKPEESRLYEQDPQKFHRNPKITKRFWR